MFKTISLAALVASSSAQLLFQVPESVQEIAAATAWPKINVYPNAENAMVFFTFDTTTKTLKPFMNMSGKQLVDSDGNRLRADFQLDFPGVGQTTIATVTDLNKKTMTEYIAATK